MIILECSDSLVGNGVERAHLDTAGTSGAVHGELDVALVAPGGVPGVLDEPVVLAVLSTVADSEDGVVEVGAALAGGKDTGLVGLEDHLVGLNGDGEGTLLKSSLHLGLRVGGNVGVVGDGDARG